MYDESLYNYTCPYDVYHYRKENLLVNRQKVKGLALPF